MFEKTPRDGRILREIYAPFAAIVEAWLNTCWQLGYPVHLSQGFRYFGEQDELYKSGKSNAKGGESFHNYGLAVDFVFDNSTLPGVQDPYKEPTPGAFKAVADLAVHAGMVAGIYFHSFPDTDHVQAKITTPIDELKSILLKEGIKGVFAYLDSKKELV